AVLAQQGQNLAGLQLQRDGVVGGEAAEALGDAVKTQHRGAAATSWFIECWHPRLPPQAKTADHSASDGLLPRPSRGPLRGLLRMRQEGAEIDLMVRSPRERASRTTRSI